MSERRFMISEVCERLGVEQRYVAHCIRARWIIPASADPVALDDEDLARLALIHDLQEKLGVNEEALPVVLHLLDQLYELRRRHGERAA